jgi:hypothetical protein
LTAVSSFARSIPMGGGRRGYRASDPEGNLWSFGRSKPETV